MADRTRPDRRRAGLRLVLSRVWVRRGALGLALLGAAGHTAAQLATPLVAMWAVDGVVRDGTTGRLPLATAALLLLAVVRAASGGLRKYNASRLGALVGTDLRSELFAHLQTLSARFYERMGTGQLVSRVSSDALAVDTSVGNFPFLVQSLVMAVGSVTVLVLLQPLLGLAVSVTVLVLSALPLAFSHPLQRAARAVAEANGDVTGAFDEQVRGLRVVKGLALEEDCLRAAGRANASLLAVTRRNVTLRAAFVAAFVAVPSSAVVLTLGLGGRLADRGDLTTGGLLAFLGYVGGLVGVVPALQQLLTTWPAALASAARVGQVLGSRPDIADPPNPRPLPPGPGAVVFRDVRFGYAPGREVLRGLDLEVAGGTSLALVGASGAGKTSLVRLLLRTHDAWSGEVLLDGVPVGELALVDLRRATGVVFQDPVVFSGTVAENIAMGRAGAADEDVRAAARLALVDVFVPDLSDGYDTVVGEQGASLSGGQRQRLAVARAILREPRVLVLDDATSALDPDSQRALGESLRSVMRGRTTLLVSHRLETVLLADEVAVLDAGRVVGRGPTHEMLSHPALRKALALGPLVDVAP